MIRGVKLGSHYWVYFSIVTMPIVESSHCNSFEERISVDSIWGLHDDVIKWNHFPRYWPFVRGIHRSPVNSPHKGQWRGALIFSSSCAWINDCVNNREAGDVRRYRAHYDVTVMRAIFKRVVYLTTWSGTRGVAPLMQTYVAYQCLSPALFDLKILIEKKSPYCIKPHIPCGAM